MLISHRNASGGPPRTVATGTRSSASRTPGERSSPSSAASGSRCRRGPGGRRSSAWPTWTRWGWTSTSSRPTWASTTTSCRRPRRRPRVHASAEYRRQAPCREELPRRRVPRPAVPPVDPRRGRRRGASVWRDGDTTRHRGAARRYHSAVDPVDLAMVADDFDREVAATPAIDRFCSSSAWILAASAALMLTASCTLETRADAPGSASRRKNRRQLRPDNVSR